MPDPTGGSGFAPPQPPEPFQILTRPSVVQFALQGVQPPSRVYIALNDVLRIDLIASQAVVTARVQGRLLRADGTIVPFEHDLANAAPNVLVSATFQEAEGFLLSLAVTPATAPTATGTMYVQVGVQRSGAAGLVFYDVLVAGYCEIARPVAWPGYACARPQDGRGAYRGFTQAAPGAGADISFACPPLTRMRVTSVAAALTASAAVANRIPRLAWNEPQNTATAGRAGPNQTLLASTVGNFTWFAGGPATGIVDGTAGSLFFQAAIPEILLAPGAIIATVTDGIQGADQWSAMIIVAETWVDLT
jgi:hypothetical protein